MATPFMSIDPTLDIDKMSYEIFSILESKFLFGYDDPKPRFSAAPSPDSAAGKVRILSIDGGVRAADGLLAAAALVRLESLLRHRSGDEAASIADFFDVAAGSGAGGVLAAMLFTKGSDGRPIFTAGDAMRWFSAHRGGAALGKARRGIFRAIFRRSGGGLRRIFGGATMRDALKSVLIPCYDLATGAPFLFSRADAVESEGFDFGVAEVCEATCAAAGGQPVELRSVDGRTRIAAVGSGVAMGNPTAAAITHVLNNKQEFPLISSVDDLFVLSIGTGSPGMLSGRSTPCSSEFVKIAVDNAADMVDQAVATAFGRSRGSNYVRIQVNGFGAGDSICKQMGDSRKVMSVLDDILGQRNVESSMFRGRKLSELTNVQKLEYLANEIVKEEERRKKSPLATVIMKQLMTPRTSSATASTIITQTTTSSTSSTSPCR